MLRRNDDYWGERPEVETATFVWRPESSVRASMVAVGEADLAPEIAYQDATDPDMDVSYFNSETTWLRIDASRPPLDDIRIRRALNYAIDRQAMLGTIFPADAIPATQPIGPWVAGHNADLPVWPYEPETAKALIAEARADGVPVDNEITILARADRYPNATESMEAMGAMLSAVGFNIKVQMMDPTPFLNYDIKPFPEDRGPILLQTMHDNAKGDAVFTFNPRYGCDGIASTICYPDIDARAQETSKLLGEDRVQAWQALFRTMYEDVVPDIYMYHMVGFSRVGPRIDFHPTVTTHSEIQIADIRFK